jgi:hypothetical protein
MGIGLLLRAGRFAFCETKIRADYRCMNEAPFSVQLILTSSENLTWNVQNASGSRECTASYQLTAWFLEQLGSNQFRQQSPDRQNKGHT